MKVLITGGAGFIGSSLVSELLKANHTVIVVDNFNSYYNPEYKRENIKEFLNNGNFVIFEGDITDINLLDAIFSNRKIDKVVHLAASVGVRNSIKHPDLYAKNNIDGTKKILTFAHKFNIKHFIFASSSSVYGNKSPIPFSEDNSIGSGLNPYAKTKKGGEKLCFLYHKKCGLSITIFRFFTVYGPRGRPDMAPYIFTESILNGKEIKVFGDGSAKRDFTYIDDIVRGIILGLEKRFPFEIFNLGNSSPINILSFIKMLEKLLGKKAILMFEEKNTNEMLNTYANIEKAKKMLGFNPKTHIKDGLEIFVNWYKKNRV